MEKRPRLCVDFGRLERMGLADCAWSRLEQARRAGEDKLRALVMGSSGARPWDLTLVVDDPFGPTYLLSRPSTLSELTTARALRRLGVHGPRPVELPRRSWRYKQPDILAELRDYIHRARPHTWLYRQPEPEPAKVDLPASTSGGAPGELEVRLARRVPGAFRRTAARRPFAWSAELREEAAR